MRGNYIYEKRSAALRALIYYIYKLATRIVACIIYHVLSGAEEDLTGKRKPIKQYTIAAIASGPVGWGVRALYDSPYIRPNGDGQWWQMLLLGRRMEGNATAVRKWIICKRFLGSGSGGSVHILYNRGSRGRLIPQAGDHARARELDLRTPP